MIRGRVVRDGTPGLLLGLSKVNISRLQGGEPILVTAADMAGMGLPPIEVMLMAGDTEASMSKELGGLALQPEVAGQVFKQTTPWRVQ